MKKSMKDEIKGKFHEVEGKVKEKVGKVTNNPDLTAEGHAEKLRGKVQKKLGQIEHVMDKSIRSSLSTGSPRPRVGFFAFNVVAAERGLP